MMGYSSPAMAAKPGLRYAAAMYVPNTAQAPQRPARRKYLLAALKWTTVLLYSLILPSPQFQMKRTRAQNMALNPVRNRHVDRYEKSYPKPASPMLTVSSFRMSMSHTAYPGTYHMPQNRAQNIPIIRPMRTFFL